MRCLKNALLGIVCSLLLLGTAHAQFEPGEPHLQPGGFSTADTLRKGEWLLAPIPWGWVAFGPTSKLTIAWDYPAALFGFPGGFIRYQLPTGSTDTHLSLETYAAYFGKDGHVDERSKAFRLEHKGLQTWARAEVSTRLAENWRMHLYAGGNYAKYQRYFPHEEAAFQETVYERYWSPDAGVALEWKVKPKMKIHLNYTYGNTLHFVDQVALKHMAAWQLHFAPFSQQRSAFLRNLRFDLTALYVKVPDAQYRDVLPVPIYPTVYWQWGGN